MKQAELKKVLKPLIKQCIKEVIFEEGVLSGIITEVAHGLGASTLTESKQVNTRQETQETQRAKEQAYAEAEKQRKQQISSTKTKMLDAIGKDSYNGVNLFEGTRPLNGGSNKTPGSTPLSDVDPGDEGVDISNIFGSMTQNWSQLIK
jgi:predicted transcriptional regulator